MKIAFFVLLHLVYSCNNTENNSAINIRKHVTNGFANVGVISYDGNHKCSAWALQSGVLLSAKHCFGSSDFDPNNFYHLQITFPNANDLVQGGPVIIRGQDIKLILTDRGDNDIAYIQYNQNATTSLSFAENKVLLTEPTKGQEAVVVGFPGRRDSSSVNLEMLISDSCQFSGHKDRIEPKPLDAGYGGMLYETTCEAWGGSSGSPVMVLQKVLNKAGFNDYSFATIGVVTHTFHQTPQGDIDPGSIAQDEFGSYVKDVVISPLFLAKDLPSLGTVK